MKTIEELKACPRAYVTPQEIGPLLNMHPQTINLIAGTSSYDIGKASNTPYGFIKIYKYDEATRKPMKNVKFAIYTDAAKARKIERAANA